MAEEPSPSNSNNIEMNLTAYGESKVTQVGQINAAEVKIIVDRIEPVLEQLQQISKVESPGVLKAGNPNKSLAYWQGRKTEIAQIQQWLTDKNTFLIGIEGIGGTGKSMLAAKIYNEIEGFPKQFWADVSYGAGFSDLARQVLSEFGFPVPEEEAQLMEALVKCLQSGQYLLIIDNLESLLQPDRQWGSQFYSDFFKAWVEYGGNSKVIVTTRERPELKGFEWLPLKGLQVDEGVALLTALGIRGDLGDFVELVDGHPLLLRLVADLLKEEYPQDADLRRLADLGLGNLRQLLTDPQVVGVHRRENVGMVLVLDASFERLSELQKALLLNISVYRGAVDSAAAVAVLPGSSKTEIEGELRNLVKRSLLSEKLNGKRQFEFQPVVLEYARHKAGNQTEAHQRAINYYLLNLKQQPWQTKEDIKEYLEVFHHWYQLEKYDLAFNSILFCNEFLTLRGYYTDQVDLYRQLIEAWEKTGETENSNYPAALNNLGNVYNYQGHYERAIEFLQQSLEIAKEIGDRNIESSSLMNLGNAYSSLGQYQQAINFYEQSLEILREIGVRNPEGSFLMNLGIAYLYQGQYERAIDFYQQSLDIARKIGDRNIESSSLMNLGNAYNYRGQYQQAIDFLQQSLETARKIGNRNTEGKSLANLGVTYLSQGHYQQAIDFLQQSLETAREIGDRNSEGLSLMNLGIAYNYQGQYEQAIDFLQQSLDIAREIGDRNFEGKSLINLGLAYNYQGQYQQAIEFLQQSLDIAREIGDRNSEGASLANLGLAYNYQGQYERAINFLQQSLEIARKIGDRNSEGNSLGNLGNVYYSLGQYQQAIEFYQQSLEIAREIGDRNGEAIAWFNLGEALENLNRESDALGAYRNARELCQAMGLDAKVQLCNNAIERLSQPKTPVVSRRGFWVWLRRLWRWIRSWFRR
ncbi:tetratricopeptide repeat protein [Nostoc favosum]|uniref:Tetratricopeptide repeat protein n=1 Tax=Nostoc favosum CHAB5714 TaxID=2780399 RepID=A0ABS8I1U0_9NOSO|nr:tetratricopeptide repeat protein [Nostoc favosum]MCC5597871.1 tetratricopeptide repeat protein [Nostoc favosum CHAB5714]